MATVTSLTKTRILELIAGLDGVAQSQIEMNTTISTINTKTEENKVALNELKVTTLPTLEVKLANNDILVGDINDNKLPAINIKLTNNEASIQDLNTVKIPSLQTQINSNSSSLDTLNITTLPALDTRLNTAEGNVTALKGKFPITAPDISAGAVTANAIAADAVTANAIAAGAVTASEIAADAITANAIAVGAVVAGKIATGAVTATTIAADAVTANAIAVGAVTASEIAVGAITANAIAADAVTANAIAANAITASEIAAGAITANAIAADAVTANAIAAGAVTASEIAAGAITTGLLVVGTALVDALAAVKLNASWITAGDVNADRFSIGSRPAAIVNGNMEDYETLSNGTANANGFAGWYRHGQGGVGGVLSQNIATPISGTRSMRLTMAGSLDGQRVVQTRSYPVVPGEQWHVSARVRASRTIDKSALGASIFVLNLRTSDGVADIMAFPNNTTIFNLHVSEVDTLTAGVVTLIEGYVTIPAGQRMMRMSVNAIEAGDGFGWTCDIDELTCEPTSNSFQIIDPVGAIVASIGEFGDATFHDVTTTGELTLRPEATLLDGLLLSEVLADSARGMIAAGSRTPLVSNIVSEYAIYQMEFQVPDTRAYRITTKWSMINTVASSRVRARLRNAFSAVGPVLATASSPMLGDWNVTGTAANTSQAGSEWQYSLPVDLSPGWHSLRFSLETLASPGGSTKTSGEVRVSVEDVGLPALGANLAYKPPAPGTLSTGGTDTGSTAPPQTQSYTKTYDSQASRWYSGDGAQKSTQNPDNNYFGNTANTTEGNRKAAFWFNDAKIREDLNGADVVKVEVYLYLSDGANDRTVTIGFHGDSVESADFGAISGKMTDQVRATNWNVGTGRWVNFTSAGADGWRSGQKRGLLIGPGPTNSSTYAGAIKGVNTPAKPKLRITYKK